MNVFVLLFLLVVGMAGPSQAAITFFWSCEDTTAADGDPDYSQGDTQAATGAGTPTNDASAVKTGTNGCLINAAGEYFAYDNTIATAIASPTAGTVAFWIQWPSAFTATAIWYQIRGNSSNNVLSLARTGTDELRFQLKSATGPTTLNIDSDNANIATATWYFIVMSWDAATDLARLAVYDSSGVAVGNSPWTGSFTTEPTEFGTTTTGIQWGERGGVAATYYLDNIFVGSAYDDLTCFLSNRNITSYASYSCGGSSAAGQMMLLGVGK